MRKYYKYVVNKTPEQWEETRKNVVGLYEAGYNANDVARAMKVGRETARGWFKKFGLDDNRDEIERLKLKYKTTE